MWPCALRLKFLNVLKIMLTFAETFQLKNGFSCIEAKTEDIRADLESSNLSLRHLEQAAKGTFGC